MSPDGPRIALMGSAGSGRATLAAALEQAVPGARCVVQPWDDLPDGDVLVIVASAEQGIDAAAATPWEHAAERAMPRLLAITHLDVGRVDDDEMRLIAERILGEDMVATVLPLADDDEELGGTLVLTTMLLHDDSTGEIRPADDEHRAIAATARERVVEHVMANTEDDAMVSQAMLGMEPSPARLHDEVLTLFAGGVLALAFPVLAAAPEGRPQVGLVHVVQALQAVSRR